MMMVMTIMMVMTMIVINVVIIVHNVDDLNDDGDKCFVLLLLSLC